MFAVQREVATALQTLFGYGLRQARAAAEQLAIDEAILAACQQWLRTGSLDWSFQGSFPGWPSAGCVPHPTLGDLLDGGSLPLEAFLHLADLARQVDEEIQAFAGLAGY